MLKTLNFDVLSALEFLAPNIDSGKTTDETDASNFAAHIAFGDVAFRCFQVVRAAGREALEGAVDYGVGGAGAGRSGAAFSQNHRA